MISRPIRPAAPETMSFAIAFQLSAVSRSHRAENLDRLQVVLLDLRQARHRLAAETARRGNPEFAQKLAREPKPRTEAVEIVHIVNHAEIDARAANVQIGERTEELIARAL